MELDSVNSYIQMFELISDQIEVLFKNKESEEEKDHFLNCPEICSRFPHWTGRL